MSRPCIYIYAFQRLLVGRRTIAGTFSSKTGGNSEIVETELLVMYVADYCREDSRPISAWVAARRVQF